MIKQQKKFKLSHVDTTLEEEGPFRSYIYEQSGICQKAHIVWPCASPKPTPNYGERGLPRLA